MKGQVLKILFRDDMAFLTKEVALDFRQVEISYNLVKFKAPAFWTVRVINHIENERKLFVEVLDYQVGETEFPKSQLELADVLMEIEKVTFRSIDTSGLLGTLNSTIRRTYFSPKPEQIDRWESPVQSPKIEKEPVKHIYTEPFSIAIKNVSFLTGKVSFEKKIQQFGKQIKFEIQNEDIIEQYDAIKNYFASVLKTKSIQVAPVITVLDGVITSISATSNEIEKINKSFIDEVKLDIVNTARKKEIASDKQLFTVEEYFSTYVSEELEVEHFFKDEVDFLDYMLEKSGTKHYRQLRFLSSRHKHELIKLRLVQKPFSFIFLLGGTTNFHVVWETLDTEEATYIWTFGNQVKDWKQFLNSMDNTLKIISKKGKNEYIAMKDTNFHRVFHDYTNIENGFKYWKDEIENVISP